MTAPLDVNVKIFFDSLTWEKCRENIKASKDVMLLAITFDKMIIGDTTKEVFDYLKGQCKLYANKIHLHATISPKTALEIEKAPRELQILERQILAVRSALVSAQAGLLTASQRSDLNVFKKRFPAPTIIALVERICELIPSEGVLSGSKARGPVPSPTAEMRGASAVGMPAPSLTVESKAP